jgi:dTDP-D-glucose 4,6-dehydratase
MCITFIQMLLFAALRDPSVGTDAQGYINLFQRTRLFPLSNLLLKHDYQVIGLDNLNDYYDPELKKARLELLEQYDNFTFHKADLKDKPDIDNIFETYKPTHVINLAAQAGVRYSIENPHAYVDSNLVGFMNLVFAMTGSIYGRNVDINRKLSRNHMEFSTDLFSDNLTLMTAARADPLFL